MVGDPAAPRLEVGYVKIARQDPQEKWLVKALLSMEEDLERAQAIVNAEKLRQFRATAPILCDAVE